MGIISHGMWVSLILILLQQVVSLQAEDRWQQFLARLPNLDAQQFRDQVAKPLVELSANAYRYPDVSNIPGWVPSQYVAPIAPAEGGVHALVYEEENRGADGRIVLAFRGTQLDSSQSSAADLCADVLLWDEGAALPANCAVFDNFTLDYFSQAVHYTQQVLAAYPYSSLLLTGHSLGAGLAILVSAALSAYPAIPVIGFGAPGTKVPLEERHLKLNAEKENRVFILANEWDEIMRTNWDTQVGTLCLYREKETPACVKCFASRPSLAGGDYLRRSMLQKDVGVDSCKLCFLQTHYLTALIRTVDKGMQPVCQPHA